MAMQWWSQRPWIHFWKRKDTPQSRWGNIQVTFFLHYSPAPPSSCPRGKETAVCSQAPEAGGSTLLGNHPKGAGGREQWQWSTEQSLFQLFSVTVRSVTNGRHVGYQCRDLKETTSLPCPAMMEQSKYHEDISTFQRACSRRITEIIVTLIP